MTSNKTRRMLLATVITGAMALSAADAATIVYSFTGANETERATVTSNGFSSVGVTAGDMDSPSGNTSFGSFSGSQRFEHRLKGSTADTTFTITIPASTIIDLTGLSFLGGIDSTTGSNDIFGQWELAISTGSASTNKWNDTVAGTGTSFNTYSTALSGLTGLTDTTVTFTFTTVLGTNAGDPPTGGNNNNRYITMDDITLTGSVIPEPSSALLLGLGFLALLRRRR